MEGWLEKRGEKFLKRWSKRYFVQRDWFLFYFKSDSWKSERPHGFIDLLSVSRIVFGPWDPAYLKTLAVQHQEQQKQLTSASTTLSTGSSAVSKKCQWIVDDGLTSTPSSRSDGNDTSRRCHFNLVTPSRVYQLYSPCEDQALLWVDTIACFIDSALSDAGLTVPTSIDTPYIPPPIPYQRRRGVDLNHVSLKGSDLHRLLSEHAKCRYLRLDLSSTRPHTADVQALCIFLDGIASSQRAHEEDEEADEYFCGHGDCDENGSDDNGGDGDSSDDDYADDVDDVDAFLSGSGGDLSKDTEGDSGKSRRPRSQSTFTPSSIIMAGNIDDGYTTTVVTATNSGRDGDRTGNGDGTGDVNYRDDSPTIFPSRPLSTNLSPLRLAKIRSRSAANTRPNSRPRSGIRAEDDRPPSRSPTLRPVADPTVPANATSVNTRYAFAPNSASDYTSVGVTTLSRRTRDGSRKVVRSKQGLPLTPTSSPETGATSSTTLSDPSLSPLVPREVGRGGGNTDATDAHGGDAGDGGGAAITSSDNHDICELEMLVMSETALGRKNLLMMIDTLRNHRHSLAGLDLSGTRMDSERFMQLLEALLPVVAVPSCSHDIHYSHPCGLAHVPPLLSGETDDPTSTSCNVCGLFVYPRYVEQTPPQISSSSSPNAVVSDGPDDDGFSRATDANGGSSPSTYARQGSHDCPNGRPESGWVDLLKGGLLVPDPRRVNDDGKDADVACARDGGEEQPGVGSPASSLTKGERRRAFMSPLQHEQFQQSRADEDQQQQQQQQLRRSSPKTGERSATPPSLHHSRDHQLPHQHTPECRHPTPNSAIISGRVRVLHSSLNNAQHRRLVQSQRVARERKQSRRRRRELSNAGKSTPTGGDVGYCRPRKSSAPAGSCSPVTTRAADTLSDGEQSDAAVAASVEAGAQIQTCTELSNHSLSNLVLSNNLIGNSGLFALSRSLESNHHIALRYLSLAGNTRIGKEGLKALMLSLEVNTHLKDLNLSRVGIGNPGAQEVANMLRANHTLRHLRVAGNRIGDSGVQAIVRTLGVTAPEVILNRFSSGPDNTTLTHLDLSRNPMGERGVRLVGELIGVKKSTIKKLYLDGINAISTKEFPHLFRPLEGNETMVELSLRHCKVHMREVFPIISRVLSHNMSLRSIDLSVQAPFDDLLTKSPACEAILAGIRRNHTLTTFLCGNLMSCEAIATRIDRQLKGNQRAIEMGHRLRGRAGPARLFEIVDRLLTTKNGVIRAKACVEPRPRCSLSSPPMSPLLGGAADPLVHTEGSDSGAIEQPDGDDEDADDGNRDRNVDDVVAGMSSLGVASSSAASITSPAGSSRRLPHKLVNTLQLYRVPIPDLSVFNIVFSVDQVASSLPSPSPSSPATTTTTTCSPLFHTPDVHHKLLALRTFVLCDTYYQPSSSSSSVSASFPFPTSSTSSPAASSPSYFPPSESGSSRTDSPHLSVRPRDSSSSSATEPSLVPGEVGQHLSATGRRATSPTAHRSRSDAEIGGSKKTRSSFDVASTPTSAASSSRSSPASSRSSSSANAGPPSILPPSPFAYLCLMTSLRTLVLRKTGLLFYPEELKHLSRLRNLDLSHNSLSSLPPSVGDLTTLSTLSLRANRLDFLPSQLRKLVKLKLLDLTKNQVPTVPRSVLSTRYLDHASVIHRLFSYLHDVGSGAWKLNTRVKMMVVGDAAVGKTSLIERLSESSVKQFFHGVRDTFKQNAPPPPWAQQHQRQDHHNHHHRPHQRHHRPQSTSSSSGAATSSSTTVCSTGQGEHDGSSCGGCDPDAENDSAAESRDGSGADSETARTGGTVLRGSGGTSGTSGSGRNRSQSSASSSGGLKKRGFENNVATDGVEITELVIKTKAVLTRQPPPPPPTSSSSSAEATDAPSRGNLTPTRARPPSECVEEYTINEVTFGCWDFAGQDIYLGTHQWFLSDRAIYIVAFDLAKDDFRKVEYWMKCIEQRTRDAVVLFVGTHLDEVSRERETAYVKRIHQIMGIPRMQPPSSSSSSASSAASEKPPPYPTTSAPSTSSFFSSLPNLFSSSSSQMPSQSQANKSASSTTNTDNDDGSDNTTSNSTSSSAGDTPYSAFADLFTRPQASFNVVELPSSTIYPSVKVFPHVFTVSSLTRKGVSELQDALVNAAFSQRLVGQHIPKSYYDLERQISLVSRQLHEPIISWEKFTQVAMGCNITSQSLEDAARFLHECGALLYFPDVFTQHESSPLSASLLSSSSASSSSSSSSPWSSTSDLTSTLSSPSSSLLSSSLGMNFSPSTSSSSLSSLSASSSPSTSSSSVSDHRLVVVDPAYLTEVMASVVSVKQRYSKNGILLADSLVHVWRQFPPHLHPVFLSLLQRFEVALPLPDTRSLMIPDLLPTDMPRDIVERVWPSKQAGLRFGEEWGRVYRMRFLPFGFFGRMCVRLLSWPQISKEHFVAWQGGLILCMSPDESVTPATKRTRTSSTSSEPDVSSASSASSLPSSASSSSSSASSVYGERQGGSKAFLKYDDEAHCLEISVRRGVACSRSHGLLRLVIETVETLLAGWYNVITGDNLVKITAVCPHCVRLGFEDPYEFSMSRVVEAVVSRNKYIECGHPLDPDTPVPITFLAPDLALVKFREIMIPFENLSLLEKIGEGSCAEVFRARMLLDDDDDKDRKDTKKQRSTSPSSTTSASDNTDGDGRPLKRSGADTGGNTGDDGFVADDGRGQMVAVKRLTVIGDIGDPNTWLVDPAETFNEFQREVWLMSGVEHPNVVHLVAICLSPLCLVMEFVPHGTLLELLEKHHEAEVMETREEEQEDGCVAECAFAGSEGPSCTDPSCDIARNQCHVLEESGCDCDSACTTTTSSRRDTSNSDSNISNSNSNSNNSGGFGFVKISALLSWRYRLRVGLDVARGMEALHACTPPIAHFDLKSLNVLIASLDADAPIVAKVCDFGLSRVLPAAINKRAVYNPNWLAVEVIDGRSYDEKADLYSFAIMLWELFTCAFPFDEFGFDGPNIEKEDAIIEGLRPTIPPNCPSAYADLIRQLWDANPTVRPSFTECIFVLETLLAEECSNV